MLREIKDLSKWREILCLQFKRFNIVRMSVFKLINRFNTVSIKIPAGTFEEILKLYGNVKRLD